MTTAAEYLFAHSTELQPRERLQKKDVAIRFENRTYKLTPVGQNIENWFKNFSSRLYDDMFDIGAAHSDERFFEVCKATSAARLSVAIPAPAPDDLLISYCNAVSNLILEPARGRREHAVSIWYELDEYVYGVWPSIGLTFSQRQAAVKLLVEQWPGLHNLETLRPNVLHFSHYDAPQLVFPLPGAGARLKCVLDDKGEPMVYDSQSMGRHYAHLTVEGAFANSLDPNVSKEQSLTLFRALRLSNLEGCVNRFSGKLDDKYLSYAMNVLSTEKRKQNREEHERREAEVSAALGEQIVPAVGLPPEDFSVPYARLTFDEHDIFDWGECVGILQGVIKACEDTGDKHYRAAYEQLNKWFLKEGYGVNGPLYYKGYETKLLLSDPTNRMRFLTLVKTSEKVVRTRLNGVTIKMPHPVTGKEIKKPIFPLWLEHPKCNMVAEVVSVPMPSSPELPDPYAHPPVFNSWRGWDYFRLGHHQRMMQEHSAKTFDQLFELPAVKEICAFLYGVLCDGDVQVFRMTLYILSNIILRPDSPCQKAMCLLGEEGVGKSLFIQALVDRIFGSKHSVVFANAEYAVGNFNSMLSGIVFAAFEEATGDKETAAKLQQLITGLETITNEKFGELRKEINRINLWLLTNRRSPMYVNEGARRYVCSTVCDLVVRFTDEQKTVFFAPLVHHLRNTDGIYEFAYFLSRFDLEGSGWMGKRQGIVLQNHTLAVAKVQSMGYENPVDQWLYSCCASRSLGQEDEGVENVYSDPLNPQKVTGTKRNIVNADWKRDYTLPKLYEYFKRACPRAASFNTSLDLFVKSLVEALKDAQGFSVCEQLDLHGGEYPDSVRSVKMPSVEAARYSLERKIGGLALASGSKWIKSYLKSQARNRDIAALGDQVCVLDLLPTRSLDAIGRPMLVHLFGSHSGCLLPVNPAPVPVPPRDASAAGSAASSASNTPKRHKTAK